MLGAVTDIQAQHHHDGQRQPDADAIADVMIEVLVCLLPSTRISLTISP
jgi:hypothetical protein